MGLGLLNVETTLAADKRLARAGAGHTGDGIPFSGYEMHMGVTEGQDRARSFACLADGSSEGAISPDGRVIGTDIHGLFVDDRQRSAWLTRFAAGLDHHPLRRVGRRNAAPAGGASCRPYRSRSAAQPVAMRAMEHGDKRNQDTVSPTVESKRGPDVVCVGGAAPVPHQRIIDPDPAVVARARQREPERSGHRRFRIPSVRGAVVTPSRRTACHAAAAEALFRNAAAPTIRRAESS